MPGPPLRHKDGKVGVRDPVLKRAPHGADLKANQNIKVSGIPDICPRDNHSAAQRLRTETTMRRETHHRTLRNGLLVNSPPPNDEKVFACSKPQQPSGRRPPK
ncbi:hypothetical protein GCM10023346_06890 [Arthrobacter gyeryongensis]|uniref:Uncharacterized protein n=1 Tax=Arthrobacter gyeryongensis TaxID=1650592 RepID=A0ABP9S1L1_9MICC